MSKQSKSRALCDKLRHGTVRRYVRFDIVLMSLFLFCDNEVTLDSEWA